ncbi:type II toxin-antitoxin system VapC family toxin [Candidatus Curtissbacteria bacterium]|nr:type II toxin-antitoxin system VapC family toxin [Candidatus Curtissbacteria bacterium]
MNRYLVDSSVFVAVLRGREPARKLLESIAGEIVTSSVCLAELYEGVYRSKKQVENERSLLKFLTTFDGILTFGTQEANMFGKLKVLLKQKPIPDMDLQIAATCIQNDSTLVTYDERHFNQVPHLNILNPQSAIN